MPICPAGHQTLQNDFCDICGLPVPGGQSGLMAAMPQVPVASSPVICPQCQTPNVADALFCEACGFDFTTGTMPAPVASAVLPPAVALNQPSPSDPGLVDALLGPATDAPESADAEPSDPPVAAVDPVTDEAPALAPVEVGPADPPDAEPAQTPAEPEVVEPSSTPDAAPDPASDVSDAAVLAAPDAAPAPMAPPSVRPTVEWVAELWIDPDWYTAQGSTDPLPSPGLPDIVPLVKESNLIGRVSHSRGIFPDVDCDLDTGCSRRHAMLTTDGTRWWIEDLNSANGTFVGAAAGPLPAMPIPQGRVELNPGQRVYVGAWTRIVIRRATDDEKEALA
jgi:hypothetical protein